MTIRKVLKMGDPRLLRVAEPVTGFDTQALHKLVEDMLETMRSMDGAGLAAPQIGVNLRLVVFEVASNPRYPQAESVPLTVLVNPEIEILDARTERGWEGCLSVPGMRGLVPRYREIRYSGFTPSGERLQRQAADFHARVVQHECDHLDGILYPQRMDDLADFGFTDELAQAGSLVTAPDE